MAKRATSNERIAPDVANETTPLLVDNAAHGAETTTANQGSIDGYDDRPLDRLQIFLLSYTRIVEPLVFFSIFPFMNQMIFDTDTVPETDVGFYSGLIESIFSMTQIPFMLMWGRLGDRWRYKPVLLISLAGIAVCGTTFGLAREVWQMIVFRSLAGIFSGTIVTVRVLFTLNSTPKTEARAFSLFAFAGNLAIFLGPLIGGFLAKPASQYPNTFLAHIQLFKDFPYLLPCLATGMFSASAMILNALFLKEPTNKERSSKTANASATSPTDSPPLTTRQVLTSPDVPITLFMLALSSALGIAFTVVLPVWWFTSVSLGGLSFPPSTISLFLALIGISQAIWLLLIFPPLQRKFGTMGVMRLCTTAWPIAFTWQPCLNLMRRFGEGEVWNRVFWGSATVFNVITAGIAMEFTAVQLQINAVSPPNSLGTLNGLALSVQSLLRAVIPGTFSAIFAVGVRNQILGGELIWVPLVSLAALARIGTEMLPGGRWHRGRGSGREGGGV